MGFRPMTFVAVRSSLGGVSYVCHGAGDGTSHSRPSAPSHGRCGAGSPLPRMAGNTTNSRKNTCVRPKPSAPTGRQRVEVGELHRVVGHATRHAGQPRKCIGKNVTLKKISDDQKWILPRVSLYITPVHLGAQ